MKEKSIRFFTSQDNLKTRQQLDKPRKAKKQPTLTGSISAKGIVVFPVKTASALGMGTAPMRFKVGIQEGKRKLASLYLVQTDAPADGFELVKAGRSYGIELAGVLTKNGLDFKRAKHVFVVKEFGQDGLNGYVLRLTGSEPKVKSAMSVTGKKRGRPRKTGVAA
ncbi:hypothetical protein J2I47_07980 [Fibrella sp. HMF5335]|uniref:Uncharacterized protein n=1 Tax=Fibrella rubiginis TaxID=2817060 RepID=A0A939GEU0_9BACT|nr:hypothetical protein [Fibrella rubiginis]MBO0936478.1 hypothetical protein [Fibrella rubiginis]